jgi:hypothetical protein
MTYVTSTVSLTVEVDFDTDGKPVKINKAKVAKALIDYLQELINDACQGDTGLEDYLSDTSGWCVNSWTLSYDKVEED